MKAVSIVVPTLNEAGNINPLVKRIDATLSPANIIYEILFVDDHSKDATVSEIRSMQHKYPVGLLMKKGARGKAYSLLEGFSQAQYDVICMIDADLQYPPEAIVPMFNLLESTGSDLIVTEREQPKTSFMRKLSSKVFNFAVTRMLFGFNYDSQSGLKLFRSKVYQMVSISPTPWSFDLEFIVRALEKNFKILSYKIPFAERYSGEAKVRVLKVSYELMKASLKLRFNSSPGKVKSAYKSNLKFAQSKAGMLLLAVFVTGISLTSTGLVHAEEAKESDHKYPVSVQTSPNIKALSEASKLYKQAEEVVNPQPQSPAQSKTAPASQPAPQQSQKQAAPAAPAQQSSPSATTKQTAAATQPQTTAQPVAAPNPGTKVSQAGVTLTPGSPPRPAKASFEYPQTSIQAAAKSAQSYALAALGLSLVTYAGWLALSKKSRPVL